MCNHTCPSRNKSHTQHLRTDKCSYNSYSPHTNDIIDKLKENVSFEMWGPRGETESVVRFVTGWTTTDATINDGAFKILNAQSLQHFLSLRHGGDKFMEIFACMCHRYTRNFT